MDEQTELLREAVELLRLIAEPHIAKRDAAIRASLHEIVGKNEKRVQAVFLMDGSRTQADICKQAKIDQGALSRLAASLRNAGVLQTGERPKLSIQLPPNFPERSE